MLLPSFITETHVQPSAFSSFFQDFFFFFFFFFFLIYLRAMRSFPWQFFYCLFLFLFCSTVSLVFRLWHQTLRWRSHRSVCLHLVALYFIDSNVLAMMYAFMLLHSFPWSWQLSNTSAGCCNGTMLALVFAWRFSTLVFVVHPCQLFLSWSRTKFAFALRLPIPFFASKWSCANSCICIEASPLLCLLKQICTCLF